MRYLSLILVTFLCVLAGGRVSAAPLRVLISSDTASFREAYSSALQAGGATVTQADAPRVAELAQADVVLLHRRAFSALPAEAQLALATFAERGGGVVAVNGAVAAGDAAWGRSVLGGAWDPANSRKFTSRMMLNVRTDAHPIVREASMFDVDDDTLYDLALADGLTVLGSAFTPKVTNARANARRAEQERNNAANARASIYDIQPQMWAFEGGKHRAAVFLQGAEATLRHASFRSFVLRGVAWAARRENVDELCAKGDLATLRYPAGGPLTATEAIKQFEMQPGFKASVIATEPLINKPIAIQWDARGRLWVAETPEYPNGRRPLTAEAWKEGGVLDPGRYDRPARDRVSILEDTDGDGLMDKKTVFHEGLELITGFCMHRDGVIVVAQPNIVWLRDTDGDNKADKEIPLFGGFTPGDTHFVANHFIPAPDGWIYASTGSGATATKPGTKDAVGKISGGVFRFKADGSAIEQVASQGGNTFGADVTSDMELFHGKATSGNPIQHVVLPEWTLARAGGTTARSMHSVNPGRTVARKDLPDRAPLMQIDQVGRYSAACSSLIYEGGAWPAEYNGRIFVTEPILDIIHHERLVPDGASLRGELELQDKEWLRSRDHFFTPITLAIGPDGAMYVLDFYTPVVAHNDTRGPQHSKSGASVRPDREHYFGRIYRIQHEGAPKLAHPDLTKAGAVELVAAFRHPNRTVRFNAIRVLMESADTLGQAAVPALVPMAQGDSFAPARILALWSLHRLGRLTPELLAGAAAATDAGVRKNAMLIAESGRIPLDGRLAAAALADGDVRVRLAVLRALGASPMTSDAGAALLAAQARMDDAWSKAGLAAASAANPVAQLEALLQGGDNSATREEFARSLAVLLAGNNDAAGVLRVLNSAAKAPSSALAATVVGELSQRPPPAPADATAGLTALRALLAASDPALASAALPLAVAWDREGTLRPEIARVSTSLFAVARDAQQPAARRLAAVRSLLAARSANAEILPGVIALVTQPQPDAFRRDLIAALATTGDAAVGRALTGAFNGLPTVPRDAAFNALASRPEWAGLLLDALEAKKFSPAILGPTQTSRLTAHPDAATSARARKLFAALGGGTDPAKDEIIARLRPAVEAPGNIVKGRELFGANCATCHRLAGAGFELGPDLDGIGSHPAAELLMHIVDPNRMVDDEHRTWNITMKDGSQYSALISTENAASVKIRMAAGVTMDLKTADIATRVKVANSLMPEGLEALGAEALRDTIAYIQSVAPKTGAAAKTASVPAGNGAVIVPMAQLSGDFRPLDLAGAFTADTRKGLYASEAATSDTLPFVKFGRVLGNGVPFEIADAAKTTNGRNVIVLKGGPERSFARGFAQRVEVPVGTSASRLHFLSGVAGWGGGRGGDDPAMIVTLHYAGGETQTARLLAGREFADYIRRVDVPGSEFAPGIVGGGKQIRTFAIPVEKSAIIEKLVLESPANRVAPTVVAITAELGAPQPGLKPAPPAGKAAAPSTRAAAPEATGPRTIAPMGQKFAEPKTANTLRILLVGAGSSHDFPRFFLGADAEVLRAAGGMDTAATPNLDEALALLPQADVLVFSGNHAQFGGATFQAALNKFADDGKGLVLLHAGVWRNWRTETGFNQRFVGGGAKGHGHGEFEVTVKQPGHALMKGVPAMFKITDESYHVELDKDAPVEILAENAPDKVTKRPHPSVWVVKDPKTRIVCISLGHAVEAHGNPAFKTLLVNSVRWVGARER